MFILKHWYLPLMSTNITPAQRKEYMDILRDYIFKDIQAAINGNANYLAALGLSTYTENLGGLYCGDLKDNLCDHYMSFIKVYFPKCYGNVYGQLKGSGITKRKYPMYEIVRSGLVHEYFMKAESIVTIGANNATCGIIYGPPKYPSSLIFVVDKYFEDFKNAFNKYYNRLLGTSNGILQGNFDRAINGMLVCPFSSSSGLTGQSGAGLNI
jgi:hypothetical protein